MFWMLAMSIYTCIKHLNLNGKVLRRRSFMRSCQTDVVLKIGTSRIFKYLDKNISEGVNLVTRLRRRRFNELTHHSCSWA